MKGIANVLLGVIIVSFLLMSFTNFLLFFPWYLTIVYKTFSIATEASTVNYVQVASVKDAKDDFASRAIFKENMQYMHIYMVTDKPTEITGNEIKDDEDLCLQRGKKFTVTTTAKFPVKIKFFNKDLIKEIDIKFSIPTTGIRYYKNLQ